MASLGPHRSVARCAVRSTMTAFKIPAVKFRRAAASSMAVRMIDIHCNDSLLLQTQTSAARYARISLNAQLAACLLDVSSLLASDSIFLKQGILAEMLAVRRSSVTEVGSKLRASGVISYSRGSVTVLDRARLLKLSRRPQSKIPSVAGLFHFKIYSMPSLVLRCRSPEVAPWRRAQPSNEGAVFRGRGSNAEECLSVGA